MNNLIKLFDQLNRKRKNRIAIGVLYDYPLTIASLKKVKKYMDLTLVGPKKIHGFNCIQTKNSDVLVELANEKKVDAIFRGNFDAVDVYNSLHKILDFSDSLNLISPVIIKKVQSINDNLNAIVTILPCSPSNDDVLAKKIINIDSNIKFFESFKIKPRIGFLSAGKPTDVLEGIGSIDKTLTEAEFLVNWYKEKGYQAKHFNHQVEYAVLESEIIVYPNGIAGNQGIRAILFFGDSMCLGSISTNLPIVYGQIAEAFRNWEPSLLFLNAYLNKNLLEINDHHNKI